MDGAQRWGMVHVDDAGSAFALAIDRAAQLSNPEILNLVADSEATVREMAAAVARAAEGAPARIRALSPDESRARFGRIAEGLAADQRFDARRARTLLGWEPRRPTFAAGAAEWRAEWRNHSRQAEQDGAPRP